MADEALEAFIENVCGDSHLRSRPTSGDGFVRLRSAEAERRQAAHDIRSTEDIVIEMLRNARDAHAKSIFLAVSREGQRRRLVMIDDGDGVPAAMHELVPGEGGPAPGDGPGPWGPAPPSGGVTGARPPAPTTRGRPSPPCRVPGGPAAHPHPPGPGGAEQQGLPPDLRPPGLRLAGHRPPAAETWPSRGRAFPQLHKKKPPAPDEKSAERIGEIP